MNLEALRAIARWHAWSAWIATLAIAVALWAHARRRPGAPLAAAIAIASVVATSALGLALHDGYRARLRQKLFVASASLGWLFERKHHLAFGAALLALSAAAATTLARRRAGSPMDRELASAASIAWIASLLFALAASVASAIVARRAAF